MILNYLLQTRMMGWSTRPKAENVFWQALEMCWLSFVLGVECKILMQVYYTLRLLIKQILNKNIETYLIPYFYTFLCHSMKT